MITAIKNLLKKDIVYVDSIGGPQNKDEAKILKDAGYKTVSRNIPMLTTAFSLYATPAAPSSVILKNNGSCLNKGETEAVIQLLDTHRKAQAASPSV